MDEYDNYMEQEIVSMLNDTSRLAAQHKAEILTNAATAAYSSNVLTDRVEFWKWMDRNYKQSGIFSSNQAMRDYIEQGGGKEAWLQKQLQGKGYEWDWMQKQRANPLNIFKQYDAGDVANRAASDVTETNILTGKVKNYQLKAYIGKTNPDLSHTPKDMEVITNAEKVAVVKKNGYENVTSYKDSTQIDKDVKRRMDQIKNGTADPHYTFKNVSTTMAKAGIISCLIGIGMETVSSYRLWKSGEISGEEYLKGILMAGGDAGATSAATAGIMIPISSMLTVAGVTSVISLPVGIIVSSAVNKIVAPCFGRGEYRKMLNEAHYYQSLDQMYNDVINSMENASEHYYNFIMQMKQQESLHQQLKNRSMQLNEELKNLYDSI